jgi:hypothetical protein
MRAGPVRVVGAAIVIAACHAVVPPAADPVQLLGAAGAEARSRVVVDSSRGEVVLYAGPFLVPAMTPAATPIHQHVHATPNGAMPGMAMPIDAAPVAAASPSHEGHSVHAYSPVVRFDWPVAGWYRGFRISLVDAHGTELPRTLMHHVIGVDFDRRQLLNGQAERFLGAGPETPDIVLPRLIGIPMKSGQKLGVYAAWHNETGTDVDGVYIRIVMPYVAANAFVRPLSAFPVYMDVNDTPGLGNAFDVPPGRSERVFEFTMPLDGRLLSAGGHLHDHGRELRLVDVQSGQVLVRLDARLDSAERIIDVPTRLYVPLGLQVLGGRRYRVVGEYDSGNVTTIVLGGMAHIIGLFVPDDPALWPPVDLNDPQMRADLASLPGGARALAPVIGTMEDNVARSAAARRGAAPGGS